MTHLPNDYFLRLKVKHFLTGLTIRTVLPYLLSLEVYILLCLLLRIKRQGNMFASICLSVHRPLTCPFPIRERPFFQTVF